MSQNRAAPVKLAIIGEGPLTRKLATETLEWVVPDIERVCAAFPLAENERNRLSQADMIVWLQEAGSIADPPVETELNLLGEIPRLCASYTSIQAFVGPWIWPSQSGCYQCSVSRRMIAAPAEDASLDLMQLLSPDSERQELAEDSSPISLEALGRITSLLAAELRRWRQGKVPLTVTAYYEIDFATMSVSYHRFTADPSCPVCGSQPTDSADAARISFAPQHKPASNQYRTRPLANMLSMLKEHYIDSKCGLLTELAAGRRDPFPVVTARLPLLTTDAEYTVGRSFSYSESEGTAILEGLERYCGIFPRGKRSSVYESYEEVKDRALNPLQFGVYTESQYALPDFPYEPFASTMPLSWVWGYSLTENKPILVPESLAYYSAGYADSYVTETSNGCSLGGSRMEAIFHGMLEVIERDCFLMSWYHRLPLPPVSLSSATNKRLKWMCSRINQIYNFEVRLFNMTMDTGMPAIWALLRNRDPLGPRLINAAAAHPDPEKAAIAALHEASALIPILTDWLERNREEAEHMVKDSSLVREMQDHILVYAHPDAESRLDFLVNNKRTPQSFAELVQQASGPVASCGHSPLQDMSASKDADKVPAIYQNSDLVEDVMQLVERLRALQLEVIVVDQTGEEILGQQLYCVKVLIPGMLPIAFGHHMSRLSGLPRLNIVPEKLGFLKESGKAFSINPHPHPFP